MKGIKNRGSQIHKDRTRYDRRSTHKCVICPECGGRGRKRKFIPEEKVWDDLAECPRCEGYRVLNIKT